MYEAGQVQTFFRQAIESMKDVIPADLIQKRIQFEQQGKAKQYESDLGKTFKKNSRDVAIESMKEALIQYYEAAGFNNLYEGMLKDKTDEEIKALYSEINKNGVEK